MINKLPGRSAQVFAIYFFNVELLICQLCFETFVQLFGMSYFYLFLSFEHEKNVTTYKMSIGLKENNQI